MRDLFPCFTQKMKELLAIVGDFNPENPSHIATNEAIKHSSAALRTSLQSQWVATEELAGSKGPDQLAEFGGLWIAPASPYKSMDGALRAIRWAREQHIPLLGTCGGFQHILIEYARNVLGLTNAEHEESNPGASRLFISRLACSLVGRSMTIRLKPGSMVAGLYGKETAQEEYYCNFGVNPEYVTTLRSGPLRVVGDDDEGEVRVVELPGHPFFLGTLFLPQLRSKPGTPHPVVSGFIKTLFD
jgi:CTP synthase (UTP-ammonia lyase)